MITLVVFIFLNNIITAYLNGGASESTANAATAAQSTTTTPLVVAPIPQKPAPLLRMSTGMELTSKTLLHGIVLKNEIYISSSPNK
jgi:hypothetical protein